jgi:hypothetical protein
MFRHRGAIIKGTVQYKGMQIQHINLVIILKYVGVCIIAHECVLFIA